MERPTSPDVQPVTSTLRTGPPSPAPSQTSGPRRKTTFVPPLPNFTSLEEEAKSTYSDITENDYRFGAKGLVSAPALAPCDCTPGPEGDRCDEHCLNRQLYIECIECPCGAFCQNRRFQNKEWAKVEMTKTREKGFGLLAGEDLDRGAFVMEYVGQVLPKDEFTKRTHTYAANGMKHFYFMHLRKDEVIDATKSGCLARFINHSCAPNCKLFNWIVGQQTRMGIFTSRKVKAGEELTFDYKFERYGAKAQACYCGESVCSGYIGGGTGDAADELDEELEGADAERRDARVPESIKGFALEDIPKGVRLMHRTHHRPDWAKVLLKSLNLTTDPRALMQFRKLDGLPLLHSWLKMYSENTSVLREILRFLPSLNIIDRRTVQDEDGEENNGIEFGVIPLTKHDDKEISDAASAIMEKWTQLERSTRITRKRKLIDPNDTEVKPRQAVLPPWAMDNLALFERRKREEEEANRRVAEQNAAAQKLLTEKLWALNAQRRRALDDQASKARQSAELAARRYEEERRAAEDAEKERRDVAMMEEQRWKPVEETRRQQTAQKQSDEEERVKKLEVKRDTAENRRTFVATFSGIENGLVSNDATNRGTSSSRSKTRTALNESSTKANPDSGYSESRSKSDKKTVRVDGHDTVKLKKILAEAVIKYMSKFTSAFETKERFKRHASDITRLLVDKETRKGHEVIVLNEEKWKKIRLFVHDYVEKVIAKLREREHLPKNTPHSIRAKESSQSPITPTSTSTSTATATTSRPNGRSFLSSSSIPSDLDSHPHNSPDQPEQLYQHSITTSFSNNLHNHTSSTLKDTRTIPINHITTTPPGSMNGADALDPSIKDLTRGDDKEPVEMDKDGVRPSPFPSSTAVVAETNRSDATVMYSPSETL